MTAQISRSPEAEALSLTHGGLAPSPNVETAQTLGSLPLGARLVLRCRKDWRDATVVAIDIDRVTLSVGSPSGRTYRVRRAPDSLLSFDGPIPLLGDGSWRTGRVRYDARW